MQPVEAEVWRQFEYLDANELSLPSFEAWLYSHVESVERTLGAEQAGALFALDYSAPHALHELKQLIADAYSRHRTGRLHRDRAGRILTEYLNGTRDLWRAMRALCALRFEEPDGWFPEEFVYIDSELDLIPAPDQEPLWEPAVWQNVMERSAPILAEYQRAAREAAVPFLESLQSHARSDT